MEDEILLFVPYESADRDRCFSAWLPESRADGREQQDDEGMEVGVELGTPEYGYCYLKLRRADKFYPHGPYFLLMSLGVEQSLKRHMQARGFWKSQFPFKIEVTVLGQHEFHFADRAKPADLSLLKKATQD